MTQRAKESFALHHLVISLLLLVSHGLEISDKKCEKTHTLSSSDRQEGVHTFQCPSVKKIDLPDLEDELPSDTKVFFIESSGRDHLLHRQACSVESALGAPKIPLTVVVFTAQQLDLSHNATCQLFSRYPESRLIFRHVNREKIFKDTPIQTIFERGELDTGPHQIVQNRSDTTSQFTLTFGTLLKDSYRPHFSDALRLLLIRKYGGWYSDLDVVFMKDTSHLRNVITGDHNQISGDGAVIGKTVNNAVFHFDQGHPFIELCVEKFAQIFDPLVGSLSDDVLDPRLKILNCRCRFD